MNTMERLKEKRRKEREDFMLELQSGNLDAELKDSNSFRDLINLAITDYGVSQTAIAEMTDLSTAAVSRWKTGTNVPPFYGRVHARNAIVDILHGELNPSVQEADSPKEGEIGGDTPHVETPAILALPTARVQG